jgi:aspartate carbamoyltransferase catalytic subunit
MKRLLSVFDLPPETPMESFCQRADLYREDDESSKEFFENYPWRSLLQHKIMGCIFSEPSIRTRWSFEAAMTKLGGSVISSFGSGSTSEDKGESVMDTLRTASQYAEVLVYRSRTDVQDENGPLKNYDLVDSHFLNAGDGSYEHPTQAMLDAYTIWRHYKTLNGLQILIVGDVKHSRTIHSLLALLGGKDRRNKFHYWDWFGNDLGRWEPEVGASPVNTLKDIKKLLPSVDVAYLNRVQIEKIMPDEMTVEEAGAECNSLSFDKKIMKKFNPEGIVLDPGPRRGELSPKIDDDPRVKMLEQAKNGMYMRMAILRWIFTDSV